MTTDTTPNTHTPTSNPFATWRRLSPRETIAIPLRRVHRLIPLLLGAMILGNGRWLSVLATYAIVAVLVTEGLAIWATTHLRLTPTHLEIRSGILVHKHLVIPRDRIRTVDLASGYAHRLLRLSTLHVGAGDHGRIRIGGMNRPDARHLRNCLLATAATTAPAKTPAPTPLSTLDQRWLRYAPLSTYGILAVAALATFTAGIANDLNLATYIAIAHYLQTWTGNHPLWPLILIAATALLATLTLTIGAIAIYLIRFGRYHLDRTHDDILRVHTGLITRWTTLVPRHRIRGIEILESLPFRAVRAATVNALTIGTAGTRLTVLPPAPLHEARRVTALVMATPQAPTNTPLNPHPRAALYRRITRATLPALPPALALTLLAPTWTAITAWALLPLLAFLGWDRYRSLGHALTEHYLLTRHSAFPRHTTALHRDAIIGWHITQSWGQHRAGLLTLTAMTAAGDGCGHVIDIATADGLRLARAASPAMFATVIEEHGADRG